jgi:hypothetical protein
MYRWRIEFLSGYTIGRYKEVNADAMRNCTTTGNLIFCDEKDKKGMNNYLPKLVIAKGTCLSVERLDSDAKEVDLTDKVTDFEEEFKQNNKIDWI